MKKIKATISKPTISTLKFQRKSDFNKLLKFVEKETKELKNIKIPKRSQIKSKRKGMSLFGLGLLGLVGILGAGFGGGEDEKEVKEVKEEGFGIDKFMIGRVGKSKKGDDGRKQLEDFGKSTKISTRGFKKFPLFNKNPFKNIKFGSAANAVRGRRCNPSDDSKIFYPYRKIHSKTLQWKQGRLLWRSKQSLS